MIGICETCDKPWELCSHVEGDLARAEIEIARLRAEVEGLKAEPRYHPCTEILIEGLRNLPGGPAVIAKWDKARGALDKAQRGGEAK